MSDATLAGVRKLFVEFVDVAGPRAPLYQRLAGVIAEQPQVLEILTHAPVPNRIPVTLLAAIHDQLLADPSQPLARWYPNLTDVPRGDDPSAALLAFCRQHRAALIETVRTRTPQTNEIGRSAALLLGLTFLESTHGDLAQLDVGASAGLNLLVDHYAYDYAGHRLGEAEIVLRVDLREPQRPDLLPTQLPRISSRLGLDRAPVDLDDPAQLRWLEACVWPDQADRFTRLRLALAQAVRLGVPVIAGDAIADLAGGIAALGQGHPVVTTSWVLSYLDVAGQQAFLAALTQLADHTDLSWVAFESPEATPGLDWPAEVAGESLSVLRVVDWRGGVRHERVVAKGHPHGYWLTWLS